MKTSNLSSTNLSSTNLNLSSSTPLQALEAKAIKASAIAMVKAKADKAEKAPKKGAPKKKAKQLSPLEAGIRDLQHAVENLRREGIKATFERGDGKSSACAVIILFDSNELEEYKEKLASYEAELKEYGPFAAFGVAKPKAPAKPMPKRKYVFYPHPLDANVLGSVAIYGVGAKEICASIKKDGYLFGRRVKKAVVEIGLRPFVDVTFAQAPFARA